MCKGGHGLKRTRGNEDVTDCCFRLLDDQGLYTHNFLVVDTRPLERLETSRVKEVSARSGSIKGG